MKIFVVDDDSEDRQLIEDTFIGHDAEIEFANDADSAVKRLGEEGANFDKVIYDGLFGEWKKVHQAAQERSLSTLLYTGDLMILAEATKKGIPRLDKAAPHSSTELENIIFPPTGSVETK
ncbi:MAG: hypothetical protein UY17_C0024G0011 [Candidatus Beckwithbacteria bacterium GW2011_GWC2_47_9]|uniref:Response regulatory domain-containing protein n=1 Tax=Candidatus Beckwithbacteria bacterium GW2011_GWC2_47_9 TaxID=1618373 RepID=A0A0G1TZI8_9BACT|nr:MAG: hypothetical protein UY17_C0024G0011 [Candidatus Beckwithbacteria bacterium GW2011_GWC2_47_9]